MRKLLGYQIIWISEEKRQALYQSRLYAISDQIVQMTANGDHEAEISVSTMADISVFMMREAKASSETTRDIIARGSPKPIHLAV